MTRLAVISARLLAFILIGLIPTGLVAQGTRPRISAVANVASYSSGPISPGEMVVIFGTGLGPSSLVNLQLDVQGRVATSLSEVSVHFDGIQAPIIYVSERQIAAMVPYAVAGRSVVQVQVVYRGSVSDPFQKTLSASAPGIFTSDASGRGQAAITNSDGTYNSSSNPAAPGSWVTFYLTGEGPIDPPGFDGVVAAGAAGITLPISVRIAGLDARLLYAGSAPGNVNGFAQINAVIPSDLQYGGNLPLTVQIGDAVSQSDVTVAVSGPLAPGPSAPVSLSAIANAANRIVLTWIPGDDLATRFHIERRTGADLFSEIGTVPANTSTFTDGTVTAGIPYLYRVRAENDYGFSAYSGTASATVVLLQLMPPSSVQVVAVNQNQIALSWNTANTNAVRFQIERKTGAGGTYAFITSVPASQAGYQDAGLQPNTTYVYRMRSEGASGLSGYSNEVTATTSAAALPPAPVLQATAVSRSLVRLSWVNTATGVIRFRLERRTTASGAFVEIAQPGPSLTTFDDTGVAASTAYSYRIKVETAAGVSPYSNEASVTTTQALPLAPTNLRAIAASATQVNLSWTNNSPDATSIRVEIKQSGSFSDIGTAATLTSTPVTNLQPNIAYTFRVRAQNAVGYSSYSNDAMATTPALPVTVVLVHGIWQQGGALEPLARTLRQLLPSQRFSVDAGFGWGRCADPPVGSICDRDCTIEQGANELRNYVNQKISPGDTVLVGFSMGGLIARQLLLTTQFSRTRPLALITLGTPNLGYPYSQLVDTVKICTSLGSQMKGDFRANNGRGDFSQYLLDLNDTWAASTSAPAMGRWLAISATSCSNRARWNGSGCPDSNVFSDGVVCDVSARLLFAYRNRPSDELSSPNFHHAETTYGFDIGLCGNPPSGSVLLPALSNPGANSDVGQKLARFINGL